MRPGVNHRSVYAAVLAALLFATARHAGYAQDLCPGDVDGDGTITPADVTAAIPLLFDDDGTDPEAPTRTDANGDDSLGAADITAILLLQGLPCVSASPTPSPTPTADPTGPTGTATGTPTKTSSPAPTRTAATPTQTMTPKPLPTATPTCIMQSAHLGTTGGQLTANDCQQEIDGVQRYADVYTIVGTPGTAIELTATGTSLVPYLVLTDADGQFDSVEGTLPIEFVVTTTRPYQLVVSTAPSSSTQLGSYSLTVKALSCPAPLAITVNSAHAGNLTAATCPDPACPTVGANSSPADQYTFSVSQVPSNVSIAMRQLNSDDSIDPMLTLIGPDGFAVGSDDDSGGGVDGLDALMHFLALQAGTYTIIASGSGGTGGYSLALTAPTCPTTALTNIPSDRPLTCPNQAGPGCQGTLYTTLPGGLPTTCNAAPLGVPGATTTTPDIDSPADVYTFKANAGDVISVGMDSDDAAHLYLLGPLTTGSAPLVAEDDSSGLFAGTGGAQLASTLPVAGTYTIVAANDNALQLTDSPVNYTLYIQKCPFQGPSLNASTGQTVSDTFNAFDCVGGFDFPYRTYAFNGIAGQFVTTTVTSPDVDAFVRVFAPNGVHVDNDDDLFNTSGTDARANWVLPQTGRYYVEVSVSPDQGTIDTTLPLGFSVGAQSCPVSSVAPGTVNGQFLDSDCQLVSGPSGQKFDVYTFTAGTPPRAATILPPSNACVVGLFAQEGLQTPTEGCSTGLMEMPVLGTGRYGFMIAANDATTRGAYAVQVSSCPLTTLGYGDTRTGTLLPTDCADATGAPADWFWFQALADLVQFNCGLSGTVNAGFPLASVLTDAVGPSTVVGDLTDDAESMFPIGNNLGALLKVTGATPAANGSYTVSVDPAQLR